MQTDFIYCLCFYENYQRVIFYVGRSIDMKRRLGEHRLAAKNYKDGDEWVYQFASTLNACGIEWDMELLMECGPGTEYYEDYFVNKFKVEGQPVQNMKAGDSEPWTGRAYSTPEAFVAARERELEKQRAKAPKTPRKRAEDDWEQTLFVEQDPRKLVSPWMADRLKRRA